MTTEEIIQSGFFRSFISEYLEYYTYSHYQDIDRLRYVLCKSDEEKRTATNKEIERLKNEIKSLGNEGLSFAYIVASNPEDYDYDEKRGLEFWINRFTDEFYSQILSLTLITDSIYEYIETYKKEQNEDCEFEEILLEYWHLYRNWKPQIEDPFLISKKEIDLIHQIESDIETHKENDWWEIRFDEYKQYSQYSKAIEILFQLCDLLVNLERLQMFESWLKEPPQRTAKKEINVTEFETAISELNQNEKLFWKGLPMTFVIEHFRVFAERKSKNGAFFLTYSELFSFLKRGFLNDMKEPKININFANGEKGFVLKRFYEFFEIAVTEHSEVNKKEKYIELVGNCFENLGETSSIVSYFKPNKTKQNW